MTGLGITLVSYFLATGMAVDPWRHLTHMHALFFDPSRVTATAAYYRVPALKTWAGIVSLVRGFGDAAGSTFSLPVLLASSVGMLLAARETPRYLVFLLPVPALFVLLIVPTGLVVLRYLLPLTLIVDAFAAHAVLALRRARAGGVPVCPVFALLCAWRLAIAVDLTYAQEHDTRYDAATWLAAHVHPGERVEYFGVTATLPPLPAEISTRLGCRTHSLGRRARPWPGSDSICSISRFTEFLVMSPYWTKSTRHAAQRRLPARRVCSPL